MATEAAYTRVRHSFWTDPDIKRQLTPEQKELLLYYFSSPHSNMIGLYYCTHAIAADETGLHPADVEAWTMGVLAPFVTYDMRTEEVLVHRSARHNIADELKPGDTRAKKVRSLLAGAHSKYLVARFLELYAAWPLDVEKPVADPPPEKEPNRIAPNPVNDGATDGALVGGYDAKSSAVQCSAEAERNTDANASGKPSPQSFPQSAGGEHDPTDGDLMALVRKRFYVPDGKPPTNYQEGREFTCFKFLRKQGRSGREIADRIEGAALIRDAAGYVNAEIGTVDWLAKGEKLTMRALVNARSGVTQLWQLAEIKLAAMSNGKGRTLFDKGRVQIKIMGT